MSGLGLRRTGESEDLDCTSTSVEPDVLPQAQLLVTDLVERWPAGALVDDLGKSGNSEFEVFVGTNSRDVSQARFVLTRGEGS